MKTYHYFDNAASTPTDPEVLQAMLPYLKDDFANPSSRHTQGRLVSEKIEQARRTIAELIGASSDEIYFTGSGSESNNLAIQGVAKANSTKGRHIISSVIEHPSVINTLRNLEKNGFEVTYLNVDSSGQISLDDLRNNLKDTTILVTLSLGNNEIGTIFQIEEVGKIVSEAGAYLHVDACQSLAYLPIDVEKYHIDLLTFNGSKAYGPKGIAALYVRNGIQIFPIIFGGGQERSLRSGTHNVPGIIGLAKACELIKNRLDTVKDINELRNSLQAELENIPAVTVNSADAERLPNHLSVTFSDVGNLDLVKFFDERDIELSSGSACSSMSLDDSHVLRAIGLTSAQAQSTIRITLGRFTTKDDCQSLISAAKEIAIS